MCYTNCFVNMKQSHVDVDGPCNKKGSEEWDEWLDN